MTARESTPSSSEKPDDLAGMMQSTSFNCEVFIKKLSSDIRSMLDKIVLTQRVIALTKRHIQRRHHVLSCFAILVGPISGCMTISNDSSTWVRFVAAGLALCSGIIGAIIKFISYEKKATSFEIVHASLTRLKRRLCEMQHLILARASNQGVTTLEMTECIAFAKDYEHTAEKYEQVNGGIPDYYIPYYILKHVKTGAVQEGRHSMPFILENVDADTAGFVDRIRARSLYSPNTPKISVKGDNLSGSYTIPPGLTSTTLTPTHTPVSPKQ